VNLRIIPFFFPLLVFRPSSSPATTTSTTSTSENSRTSSMSIQQRQGPKWKRLKEEVIILSYLELLRIYIFKYNLISIYLIPLSYKKELIFFKDIPLLVFKNHCQLPLQLYRFKVCQIFLMTFLRRTSYCINIIFPICIEVSSNKF